MGDFDSHDNAAGNLKVADTVLGEMHKKPVLRTMSLISGSSN